MNRQLFLATALLSVMMPLASAHAQALPADFPSKPIKIVVPFAPGGSSDFVARVFSPRLGQLLGQSIIIENKSGAAGNIGMEAAAAAAPDGYTVFLGNVGTLAINPSIFGKQQKVTAANFEPVSLIANAPDILVASATVPIKNVRDVVDYAKKNSKEMSFASPGSGSLSRLEMELFREVAKLEMTHVPYKGGAGAAIIDVVGGRVPIMFLPVPGAMQLIKGGRLTAVAVASNERLSFLPDVPTMKESGFPQVVGGSWQALMLPAGTPAPIVAHWHKIVVKMMAEEDIRQRLLGGGVESVTSQSPEELKAFLHSEATRWGAVAKAVNATAD